jgi:DNA-3-methyladenine glycosylase
MPDALPPPLPAAYYHAPTLDLARDLLGKTLWRRTAEGAVAGIIVETEAYISAIDPASHNYRKPSPRSQTMFGPPGHAYIYFTYGMHYCLNVVTEPEGTSAAILIRALQPMYGTDLVVARCPTTARRDLCRGPGRVCRALALTLADDGTDLTGADLWISAISDLPPFEIGTSLRIGISQGVDLPWRFFIQGNASVSGPARLNEKA